MGSKSFSDLSLLSEATTMLFRNSGELKPRSFVLLAPANGPGTHFPHNQKFAPRLHASLLSEMQGLRGRIYLADGALSGADLDSRGRHIQAADAKSWHLLIMNAMGRVIGCTRLRRHSTPVSWGQLRIRQAPIAQSDEWGTRFRASINAELDAACWAGFSYVEVGGWALAKEIRGTFMALKTVLATFAWSQLLGGALGVTTATERNESAAILRRLGGRPLAWDGVELPPYYDRRYRCQMEVLRFDSRETNPKYSTMMGDLREQVAAAPVICPTEECADPYQSPLRQPFPLVESELTC